MSWRGGSSTRPLPRSMRTTLSSPQVQVTFLILAIKSLDKVGKRLSKEDDHQTLIDKAMKETNTSKKTWPKSTFKLFDIKLNKPIHQKLIQLHRNPQILHESFPINPSKKTTHYPWS